MFFRFGQKPAFRVRELQLVMKMMDTIGSLPILPLHKKISPQEE